MKKTIGLCLGASTVSVVTLQTAPAGPSADALVKRPRITGWATYAHEGNPKETLLAALEKIDAAGIDGIAATGRRFRKFLNLTSLPEPEAVEYAYRFVKPRQIDCPAIVSAGGETFMVYVLNPAGRIVNVVSGNKCASGTGEFFLQQLRRMDVSLDTAAKWATIATPYHVSGRCSVFCKSDCTHATNKGIPRAQVTAGLCHMMAGKILELLKKIEPGNIMLVGGTAQNSMMVHCLRQKLPGLIVPPEAPYFEALGAALWAADHDSKPLPSPKQLFRTETALFNTLPPLAGAASMVTFKTMPRATATPGDTCILGLDVGSTTTKAVLLRKSDDAILASIYLRTNSDPVGAARRCYAEIRNQVAAAMSAADIRIEGLGVCGSGRQIAGLHALTDGTINEIIAHATAAVYFDPKVDTIFEIGGQDAKYTYITNGVPSDYAMNEACSAGTGSFLEEAAFETLGIKMEAIADIALSGKAPPNFSDQCAAFIASDIKNAIHEGMQHSDIVAGLVYSICMNYANRVKGNRPMGAKIFMQGGVCYNRAVPMAMAALTGKPIVVPPEPGLMGAYGVALEVKKRLAAGLLKPDQFDLDTLIARDVSHGKSFVCKGGKTRCDRRCEIALIKIAGQKYPFGGACNRYYNLRRKIKHDDDAYDLVGTRPKLIFDAGPKPSAGNQASNGTVAFNRSFMVHTFYPLYATFFSELGLTPVVPKVCSKNGINQRNAAFCYPGELAHGFFHNILTMDKPPDFIFLPHFRALPDHMGDGHSQVCPLVQGEPFYLRAAFRGAIENYRHNGGRLLSPLVDLTRGLSAAAAPLIETAEQMGFDRAKARQAFDKALFAQNAAAARMQALGQQALAELAANNQKIAVVILARPYNGMVEEAHMGIPRKFASRGITVLPFDYLPLDDAPAKRNMYWGTGQQLLKAARIVRRHPQLFATYITNFSCGPDSFINGYFRSIMGRKPSLTLELDSHTADAGLETRIEAFLDVIAAYRRLPTAKTDTSGAPTFQPARAVANNGKLKVKTSGGTTLDLTDPRVTLLVPSMGRFGSEALAAAFRGLGLTAIAHRPADEAILKLGRAHTSGKECLPLILTTGTLLDYLNNGRKADEVVVYFFATGEGPCRFGQYRIFMEDLLKRLEIPDVALLSISSDSSYMELGKGFQRRGWWALTIADGMEDIRSMLLANAVAPDEAMIVFERQWTAILQQLASADRLALEKQLAQCAGRLKQIPLKRPVHEVPTIALTGEIFVRRDSLSRQKLIARLAASGFATHCAPVAEWVHYCNYFVKKNHHNNGASPMARFKLHLRNYFQTRDETRLKSILAKSGLAPCHRIDIPEIIACAAPYISDDLLGEAVLTIGSSLKEVATHACGVIAIGPFGCMPNRLAEAVLNEVMNRRDKLASDPANRRLSALMATVDDVPFLAIESDGAPFPQLIDAKLETFCLRAKRLHHKMLAAAEVSPT